MLCIAHSNSEKLELVVIEYVKIIRSDVSIKILDVFIKMLDVFTANLFLFLCLIHVSNVTVDSFQLNFLIFLTLFK